MRKNLIHCIVASLLALFIQSYVARADIFQWEYINPANPSLGKQPSTTLAPQGAGVYAEPGANLFGRNLTKAYLIGADLGPLYDFESWTPANLTGTNLSQADLAGANLRDAYLGNANFSQANLTNAYMGNAYLAGANLTGAEIRWANFQETGLSQSQLISTASYANHDLMGINLYEARFPGINLASQNLIGASLFGATLSGANLSQANLTTAQLGAIDARGANLNQANLTYANLVGADLRGANMLGATLTGVYSSSWIQSNGHIAGLNLTANGRLAIRDYDGNAAASPPTGPFPILVEQRFVTDSTSTLVASFDADAWDSTISFAPGIPVSRGGTLWLTFESGVNLAGQIGRTIDLFDWTGVTPTGTFNISTVDDATWDLSKLYATGEVTLTSVPGIWPGDFNYNGVVDAADYVVWRDTDGSQIGYNTWRANFGQHAGSGATLPSVAPLSAVPEPASLVLLAIGLLMLVASTSWKSGHNIRILKTDHVAAPLIMLIAVVSPATVARADIFQWEYINPANPSLGKQQSTTLAPDGAGVSAVAGANLSNRNLTMAYLIGANLSVFYEYDQNGNIIGYAFTNLRHTNLSHADVTNANLTYANMTSTNLNDANLTGATFTNTTLSGANLTQAKLTNANLSGYFYQILDVEECCLYAFSPGADLLNADLSRAEAPGASFQYAMLAGANLGQANLTNANFSFVSGHDPTTGIDYISPAANLSTANLRGADARGANFQSATLTGANTSNLIQSNGHIAGLDLTTGASLVVRDYDGNPAASPPIGPLPIVVDQHLTISGTGALKLVFEQDGWNSTISFAPGISVARGGTLELTFADDVNLATQIGRTIDLFDWTGVTPTGTFSISSPYTWNLSDLYTTGEVTLTAVPGVVPGDFNHDNTVDAADYVVWRNNDGTQAGYDLWRAHFGQTAGSGAALPSAQPVWDTVPEPASMSILLVGLLAMSSRRPLVP